MFVRRWYFDDIINGDVCGNVTLCEGRPTYVRRLNILLVYFFLFDTHDSIFETAERSLVKTTPTGLGFRLNS